MVTESERARVRTGAGVPARIPIVVGVTGHIDLVLAPSDTTLEPPRAAIERELETLLRDFPSTPIVVLSGLAEGADTLAAEVVLALAEKPENADADGRPRISLVAALPLPLALCAEDFRDPAHRVRVEAMQRRAAVTVAAWDPDEVDFGGLTGPARREAFNDAYARLGAYVSRNCHLLLALWDGRPAAPSARGGTAYVVDGFVNGPPQELLRPAPPPNPLRVPDGLRVLRIPTERASNRGVIRDPRSEDDVAKEKTTADEVLGRIDEFNEDADDAARAGLLGRDEAASGADVPGAACAIPFADVRDVADTLATRFQGRRRRRILGSFFAAALALAAYEAYLHGRPGLHENPRVLVLLGAGVLASVVIVWEARRRRIEAKYLVYRSFAESLRVQSIWREVGLPDRADDHYAPFHVHAIGWVRQGLKSLHVLGSGPTCGPSTGTAALDRLEASWIRPQLEYFHARTAKARRRLLIAVWISRVALVLSLASAVCAGLHVGGDALHDRWMVSIVLTLAVGGFARAYAGQMAYEATVDRYESAHAVFARARSALAHARRRGDTAAGLEVARALGIEALAENVGWVLLHRDHPLEIRTGG